MRVITALCLEYLLVTSAVCGQEPIEKTALINIEGNQVFSEQQLLHPVNVCLAKYPTSQQLSPDALDYCLRRIQFFLASQGYLRATVRLPQTAELVEGAKITVPVNEGARYRLGELKIEGSELFSPKQLIGMLDLKPGDVADADIIYNWLYDKVKRVYEDRGHIQYTSGVESQFRLTSEGDNIVNFEISINEGRRFTVRRIEFAGNEHTADGTLRGVLLIKEDAPYNRSLLEKSIRNLNRLKLFDEIDAERDVDFKPVGKDAQIDLIIHVKERARP